MGSPMVQVALDVSTWPWWGCSHACSGASRVVQEDHVRMNRWAVWVTVSRVHWDASGTIKTSQPWWLCAWLGVDGLEHDLGHLFMTGLGFREPCKQHWVVLQGHTSYCIKYGVVSVIQVGDKPPWIPRGQHASLAVGLGPYVGNLASANITPQCIGLPTMKQETDLEASSPMKPALSASAAVSASMANGDRWGPSSGGSERSLCLPGRHGN